MSGNGTKQITASWVKRSISPVSVGGVSRGARKISCSTCEEKMCSLHAHLDIEFVPSRCVYEMAQKEVMDERIQSILTGDPIEGVFFRSDGRKHILYTEDTQ